MSKRTASHSSLITHHSSLFMKRSPLVVIFVTVFIDLVGFGIVIPVLPYYVEGTRFNASPRMVGLLFASYSVMQLIFAPVLGRLSDKYGRRAGRGRRPSAPHERPIAAAHLRGRCRAHVLGLPPRRLFRARARGRVRPPRGRGRRPRSQLLDPCLESACQQVAP